MSMPLHILFAPDFRKSIGYQHYLAEALEAQGVRVSFLNGYARGLPLWRGTCRIEGLDAVHLHWPESYCQAREPARNWLRKQRYLLDMALLSQRYPLFLTAHNLLPHNREEESGVFRNIAYTARRASRIFAHSPEARRQYAATFGVNSERIPVIPYGDHAVKMLPPLESESSRQELSLPPRERERVCLIFGTVSPYKGISEVIEYWKKHRPAARLLVVGPVAKATYARELNALAEGVPQVELRISEQWLSEADLRLWLSAVDCAIFNYREIFTSGAAALARSFGLPLLIPERLRCADLMEPHPYVQRFDSLEGNFAQCLELALKQQPDFEVSEAWREETSWKHVAELTARAYREVLC